MSERFEIDLEGELIEFDGKWLSRADLSGRITQMIAAGDFKLSRVAGALESLDQALANAKTITFRVSAATFAKLEAAGQKLGRTPSAYARDMVEQLLGGTPLPASAPSVVAPAPASTPTPVAIPAPVANPNPIVVTPATTLEEADAVVLTPKKRVAETLPVSADEASGAEAVLDLGGVKKAKRKDA